MVARPQKFPETESIYRRKPAIPGMDNGNQIGKKSPGGCSEDRRRCLQRLHGQGMGI